MRDSKDPTVFTILFEDTAAMAGLVIAFVGIYCAQAFDMPMLDGVASIAIGCVLALTALFLAIESKGLLVGEAANPATVEEMKNILAGYDGVEAVNELLTLHFGPSDVLVTASLDFQDERTAGEVEKTVTQAEKAIKDRWPEVSRVFIEIQAA